MNLYIERKLNLRLVFLRLVKTEAFFCQKILRLTVNLYLLVNTILKRQKREGSRVKMLAEERKE